MNRLRAANSGITLIELMIVIVIIGILAAIAIPSYRGYVLRANRVDAKKGLLARADDLERCYTRNNSYLNISAAQPCAVTANLPDTSLTTYRIEADAANGGIKTGAFAIRAVPIGSQAADAQCGNFTLDDKNNRGVSGTWTAQDCWGR